jgi:transposase
VHSAAFKAQVLAECQQPGASVAAVALANGLNANLLRKWLVGRGLKRAGLAAPRAEAPQATCVEAKATPTLQFVPVEITPTRRATTNTTASEQAEPSAAEIHIELTRGATQLSVRWPSTQAAACTAWLRELAAVALKD